MSLYKPYRFLFLGMMIALFFALDSCKKDTDSNSLNPDFSWSGSTLIGDTLVFQCTLPGNYVWIFGDGDSSTEAQPAHLYHKPGKYTVSLKFSSGTFLQTVTKTVAITAGTARLAGTYKWSGYFHSWVGASSTTYPLNDTVFSITALTDSTIGVWGDYLRFYGYYPDDKYELFLLHDWPTYMLEYHFDTDSVYFIYNPTTSLGSGWLEHYSTKR
ncbi:PKD domain-containing protein [Chitinophagaceae bacterium MMS25-I14]